MLCAERLLLVVVLALAAGSSPSVPLPLAPGVEMPVVGLGTGSYGQLAADGSTSFGEYWNDTVAAQAVAAFLKQGGRRLDCSLKWYHDLAGVREGMARAGLPREQLFITSKVDDPFGFEEALASVRQSLAVLNTSYLDLVLMHWPAPMAWDFETTSFDTTLVYNQSEGAMLSLGSFSSLLCRLRDPRAVPRGDGARAAGGGAAGPGPRGRSGQLRGAAHAGPAGRGTAAARRQPDGVPPLLAPGRQTFDKHLGVLLLTRLCQVGKRCLSNCFSRFFAQDEWVARQQRLGVVVNSYSPLGAPDYMAAVPGKWPSLPLAEPAVQAAAAATGRSAAQVALRWQLQKGLVVNPRTVDPRHMAENLALFDFELTPAQMAAIDQVRPPLRPKVCPDPFLLA